MDRGMIDELIDGSMDRASGYYRLMDMDYIDKYLDR